MGMCCDLWFQCECQWMPSCWPFCDVMFTQDHKWCNEAMVAVPSLSSSTDGASLTTALWLCVLAKLVWIIKPWHLGHDFVADRCWFLLVTSLAGRALCWSSFSANVPSGGFLKGLHEKKDPCRGWSSSFETAISMWNNVYKTDAWVLSSVS